MEIEKFINRECLKNDGLDKKSKASALLESVKTELYKNINANIPFGSDDSLGCCNYPNQSEYAFELRIARYFLYTYSNGGEVSKYVRNINYPNTPKDKERLDAVRDYLQTIFE